jgi:hypothetical protein
VSTVYVYTRAMQPATRYVDPFLPSGVCGLRPDALVWTSCCRQRRRARNCTTQIYYDAQPFWCAPGKGCKVPSRRRRVTRRVLARAFESGVSMLALARRYGQPVKEIERRLRKGAR